MYMSDLHWAVPLGNSVQEYFAKLLTHGIEPKFHYYPRIEEHPSPPPAYVYLLDIGKLALGRHAPSKTDSNGSGNSFGPGSDCEYPIFS